MQDIVCFKVDDNVISNMEHMRSDNEDFNDSDENNLEEEDI